MLRPGVRTHLGYAALRQLGTRPQYFLDKVVAVLLQQAGVALRVVAYLVALLVQVHQQLTVCSSAVGSVVGGWWAAGPFPGKN